MATATTAKGRAKVETYLAPKRRLLEIPGPGGRPELVVGLVLKAMADARADEITRAEDAIRDNGLTIEVARLRDALLRLVPGDLQRLLLSTPGVPERLFLAAI